MLTALLTPAKLRKKVTFRSPVITQVSPSPEPESDTESNTSSTYAEAGTDDELDEAMAIAESSDWTREEDRIICLRKAEGESWAEIGQELDRGRRQCQLRYRALCAHAKELGLAKDMLAKLYIDDDAAADTDTNTDAAEESASDSTKKKKKKKKKRVRSKSKKSEDSDMDTDAAAESDSDNTIKKKKKKKRARSKSKKSETPVTKSKPRGRSKTRNKSKSKSKKREKDPSPSSSSSNGEESDSEPEPVVVVVEKKKKRRSSKRGRSKSNTKTKKREASPEPEPEPELEPEPEPEHVLPYNPSYNYNPVEEDFTTEYWAQRQYIYDTLHSTRYPGQKLLRPDRFYSASDCRVLAGLEAKYRADKWLHIQADFCNATGRMVAADVLRAKFYEDGEE
ncbi:hypothetical protein GGS20DRAFT_595927 [Poronia punctata]|nr:hypothetical protein GGS20DRAFT_595927 [Poronia punctata]